jgi:hypothetical protein
LQLIRNFNLLPAGSPNYPQYYWQFDWADIGLSNGNTNFFKFETSLVTATGSRYLQSFEGITGTGGFSTINFTNYDTYGVQPVPENAAAALAVFGGVVGCILLVRRAGSTVVRQPLHLAHDRTAVPDRFGRPGCVTSFVPRIGFADGCAQAFLRIRHAVTGSGRER